FVVNLSACYHIKTKVRRRLPAPTSECLARRQFVKAIVDFNCVESIGIPTEHFGRWQVFWIERSTPMLVVPSRCANVYASFLGKQSHYGTLKVTVVVLVPPKLSITVAVAL